VGPRVALPSTLTDISASPWTQGVIADMQNM
jgi:hypothetical protein